MGVERLFLPCQTTHFDAYRAGLVVREVVPDGSQEAIIRVADSCRHGWSGPRKTDGLLAELRSRPGREVMTWLAFQSDRPVGLAAVVAAGPPDAARYSIAWLLVSDECRRRGVGRALVAAAMARARERAAAEVWVETRHDWPDATAFWMALGFRPPA